MKKIFILISLFNPSAFASEETKIPTLVCKLRNWQQIKIYFDVSGCRHVNTRLGNEEQCSGNVTFYMLTARAPHEMGKGHFSSRLITNYFNGKHEKIWIEIEDENQKSLFITAYPELKKATGEWSESQERIECRF